jgi:hypothetical protein
VIPKLLLEVGLAIKKDWNFSGEKSISSSRHTVGQQFDDLLITWGERSGSSSVGISAKDSSSE